MGRPRYPWPSDISGAKALQERLRLLVRIRGLRKMPRFVAGVDAAFAEDRVIAAASLFTFPGLLHLMDARATMKVRFPYVPGYLSFREGPAAIAALEKLSPPPDLILVDGQGIAHPKGIGIASHLGVLLNISSIGCAKSRLVGEYEEPGMERGSLSPLFFEGRQVGAVLRTRGGVRPVFVSPGHLVDISSSIRVVMACLTSYRIPEPLRRADQRAARLRKEFSR